MARITQYCLLAITLLVLPCRSHDALRIAHQQGPQKADEFVFEVQPRVIESGEKAVLHWSIKGATKVVIEEWSESRRWLRIVGTFGATGSLEVAPKEDITYLLSCEGSTTYVCATVSVRVKAKKR
jgi:hypothetical protein